MELELVVVLAQAFEQSSCCRLDPARKAAVIYGIVRQDGDAWASHPSFLSRDFGIPSSLRPNSYVLRNGSRSSGANVANEPTPCSERNQPTGDSCPLRKYSNAACASGIASSHLTPVLNVTTGCCSSPMRSRY